MPPNITSNKNKCLCCWCSYHREIDKVLLLLDTHRLQRWCHCCPSIEAFSAIHKQTQSSGLDMNPSWAMARPLMRRPPHSIFLLSVEEYYSFMRLEWAMSLQNRGYTSVGCTLYVFVQQSLGSTGHIFFVSNNRRSQLRLSPRDDQ